MSQTTFEQRISETFVEAAELIHASHSNFLPIWIELYVLPGAIHEVGLDNLRPSRPERLKKFRSERDSCSAELRAAESSRHEPSIRRLSRKLDQIDIEIRSISRTNGKAKTGPEESAKRWIAASLVEAFLIENGCEPGARNPKMARAYAYLCERLGILRPPSGNPLNGSRRVFEEVLSVSDKVNDVSLRKDDVVPDRIVSARLLARRSLYQFRTFGHAPSLFPGMNGPFRNLNSRVWSTSQRKWIPT